MSDDLQAKVTQLTNENVQLKNALQQNSNGIQTLLAQVDAHKQIINENNQISVNLRTNLILVQKHNAELIEKLKVADAKLVELEAKVSAQG